jgi:outer membrane protein OmpA-like peptidoglycan-associated protein
VRFDLPCDVQSKLQGSMADYENASLDIAGSYEPTVEVTLNLAPIDDIIVGDMVVLNPIYFDFDKSNITAKAAFELDKLVAVMQKYPQIKIYATSHTDRRGPSSYNIRLSNRRAKTTVQYVISKGIDEARIEGEGKGESELKDECVSCTEAQHQSNRRSEFEIIEGNPKE